MKKAVAVMLVLSMVLTLGCVSVSFADGPAVAYKTLVSEDYEGFSAGTSIATLGYEDGSGIHAKAENGWKYWAMILPGYAGNADVKVQSNGGSNVAALTGKNNGGGAGYPELHYTLDRPQAKEVFVSFDAYAGANRLDVKFLFSDADGKNESYGLVNHSGRDTSQNHVAVLKKDVIQVYDQISATDDRYNGMNVTGFASDTVTHWEFAINMQTHLYDMTITNKATGEVLKTLTNVGLPIGQNYMSAEFFGARPCFKGITFLGFVNNADDYSTYDAGIIDNLEIKKYLSYDMTVSATAGGTVSINSAVVASGQSAEVSGSDNILEVVPDNGKQIKSITIGSAEQTIYDPQHFVKQDVEVNADTTVTVVFENATGIQYLLKETFEGMTVGTKGVALGSNAAGKSKKAIDGGRMYLFDGWNNSRLDYLDYIEVKSDGSNKYLDLDHQPASSYPAAAFELEIAAKSSKIVAEADLCTGATIRVTPHYTDATNSADVASTPIGFSTAASGNVTVPYKSGVNSNANQTLTVPAQQWVHLEMSINLVDSTYTVVFSNPQNGQVIASAADLPLPLILNQDAANYEYFKGFTVQVYSATSAQIDNITVYNGERAAEPAFEDDATQILEGSYQDAAAFVSYFKLNNFADTPGLGCGINLWDAQDASQVLTLPAYADNATPASATANMQFAVRVFGDAIQSGNTYFVQPYVGEVTGETQNITLN